MKAICALILKVTNRESVICVRETHYKHLLLLIWRYTKMLTVIKILLHIVSDGDVERVDHPVVEYIDFIREGAG